MFERTNPEHIAELLEVYDNINRLCWKYRATRWYEPRKRKALRESIKTLMDEANRIDQKYLLHPNCLCSFDLIIPEGEKQ